MKQKQYYFVFILFSLLFYCCSEVLEVEDEPQPEKEDEVLTIPDSIIAKADNFIISKVGEQFFNSYIKLNPEHSGYSPADSFCIEHPESCAGFLLKPHYYFVYNFKMPGKEFVDEIIEFVTDTTGNIVPEREAFGIPKCDNNNCLNNFPLIEEDKAIIIAQNNGLEEGIAGWRVSFHFYAGDFDTYVWEVSNTLYLSDSESGGKTLLIDASCGEVIQSLDWLAVP